MYVILDLRASDAVAAWRNCGLDCSRDDLISNIA